MALNRAQRRIQQANSHQERAARNTANYAGYVRENLARNPNTYSSPMSVLRRAVADSARAARNVIRSRRANATNRDPAATRAAQQRSLTKGRDY